MNEAARTAVAAVAVMEDETRGTRRRNDKVLPLLAPPRRAVGLLRVMFGVSDRYTAVPCREGGVTGRKSFVNGEEGYIEMGRGSPCFVVLLRYGTTTDRSGDEYRVGYCWRLIRQVHDDGDNDDSTS